jgi:predicted component of type VI protein secretion system
MDGKAAAEDGLKKLLADPQLMAALKTNLEQKSSSDRSTQEAQ